MSKSWWVMPAFDFLHFYSLQFISYMFHELITYHSLHWSTDSRSLEDIFTNIVVEVKLITEKWIHKLFYYIPKLLIVW